MPMILRRMLWLSAGAASLIATGVAAQAPTPQSPAPQSPAPQAPAAQAPAAQATGAPAAKPAPAADTSANPPRTPAPHDAYVYIGWPLDGASVGTKFKIWFGTRNFGVAPAGVVKPNTGHHHLLIDVPLPPMDQPIPNDRNHLHFGLGQTEAVVELPPGKHTLQLLMADADHVPHDPPLMSKRITIYVRPERGTPPAPAPQ